MNVVVLGGYGVFGSRLAGLLRRDGHEIWLAGRNLEQAQIVAAPIGARGLEVDAMADLSPLFEPAPNVVIDASGPFHTYGADPYRVARRCIAEGVDYLDLSDSAEFTTGIGVLDRQAQEAGCTVLSGASSVPGLSSTIVSKLSEGMDEVLSINTAILPGNRAPRGVSVMTSILDQVGRPHRVWRGGQWREMRCWSDRRLFRLAPDMTRAGYFIEVPDIRLFPQLFRARSVLFHAGMELRAFNAGLTVLSAMRRFQRLDTTPGRVKVVKRLADLLWSFGTDRGGMQVAVAGSIAGLPRQRTWTLIAEAGEGPFVPGIVCRALLRRAQRARPGARPCIAEVTLAELENAMSDLSITTQSAEENRPTLFQKALDDRWSKLPPAVRDLHSVQDIESFSGVARVTRGTSMLARLAAWFFRFPNAGENVPITVTKTRTEDGEIWERNFDGRSFRSYCSPSPEPYHYRERFWLFNYEQELPVHDGCMHLPVRRGWFVGLPIPRPLLPTSESREYARDGVFHFDVALGAPLGAGLIVRYQGNLRPDRERPGQPKR